MAVGGLSAKHSHLNKLGSTWDGANSLFPIRNYVTEALENTGVETSEYPSLPYNIYSSRDMFKVVLVAAY